MLVHQPKCTLARARSRALPAIGANHGPLEPPVPSERLTMPGLALLARELDALGVRRILSARHHVRAEQTDRCCMRVADLRWLAIGNTNGRTRGACTLLAVGRTDG